MSVASATAPPLSDILKINMKESYNEEDGRRTLTEYYENCISFINALEIIGDKYDNNDDFITTLDELSTILNIIISPSAAAFSIFQDNMYYLIITGVFVIFSEVAGYLNKKNKYTTLIMNVDTLYKYYYDLSSSIVSYLKQDVISYEEYESIRERYTKARGDNRKLNKNLRKILIVKKNI